MASEPIDFVKGSGVAQYPVGTRLRTADGVIMEVVMRTTKPKKAGLAPKQFKGVKFPKGVVQPRFPRKPKAAGAKAAPKAAAKARKPKRPGMKVEDPSARDHFARLCMNKNEADCKDFPICQWIGGKVQRCQRGRSKAAVDSAELATMAGLE